MIAYADKFRLRSGHSPGRIAVGVRSDLPEVGYPRTEDVQSSEDDDTPRDAFTAGEQDDSREIEFVRGRRVLDERFQKLVAAWREECGMLSSTTQKAIHPAYQQIIGMGPDVLPLIFGQLDEAPGHWFWALRAITGQDPVPPGDVGDIPRMTEAWLRWGRERGYL
jgi:hypothetical protein